MYTIPVYTIFAYLKREHTLVWRTFLKEFIATKNDHDKRLSRFVLGVTQNMPNSLLYKSFRNGRIKVNGKKQSADFRISSGDFIQLYINDEFFESGTSNTAKIAEKTELEIPFEPPEILWQNKDIALLHKKSGQLCHPDNTNKATLLNAFTQYLIEKGEFNPNKENLFSPTLCNRLDYGTEGIVIAAKNYLALRDMNTLLATDQVQKNYLCITYGKPPEGIQKAFLKRDKQNKMVSILAKENKDSKNITTGIEILDTHQKYTLCKITLYTGRTHQIRAHLAFLNSPIIGDAKYGTPLINKQLSLKQQALCANQLNFSETIPKHNLFSSLQGKIFQIEKPKIIEQWKYLCNAK